MTSHLSLRACNIHTLLHCRGFLSFYKDSINVTECGEHVQQWMNLSLAWLMEYVITGKVNANRALHVVYRPTLHSFTYKNTSKLSSEFRPKCNISRYNAVFNLHYTQIRLNVFQQKRVILVKIVTYRYTCLLTHYVDSPRKMAQTMTFVTCGRFGPELRRLQL